LPGKIVNEETDTPVANDIVNEEAKTPVVNEETKTLVTIPVLLRREGSNLRPSGYEPDELPLLYFAI
jgi:hypothetical protein